MGSPDPTLTVISNVWNDAERLPRAVASALAAWDGPDVEVLVVDDGSTDDTGAVADGLAASDERVRVVHRGENDGAPGAPRNLGIAEARGRYIAFCDSDDEYLPGALRRLVAAAEEQDAEVAAGGVARFNERTGRTTPLPATGYVAGPVEPLTAGSPLWHDTIAVAKVIRRDLLAREGIRFPERILYEDQPFTVAVWARARRIATLDETVYLWYVYNVAGDESITARRHEIGNFHDRIAANRAIDGYLAGRPDLASAKLDKFVRHDLALYGKDLDTRDAAYRSAFVAAARAYLAEIPPDLREGLDQPFRLAVRELVDGTPDGALAACLFAYRRHHLDRPLDARDGGWWWPYRPAEASGPEHDLTTLVRAQHLKGRPLATVVCRAIEPQGGRLSLTGTVVDGDGRLGDRPAMRLEIVDRERGTVVAQVAAGVRDGRFSASIPLPGPGGPTPAAGPTGAAGAATGAYDVKAAFPRRIPAAGVLRALRILRRRDVVQPVEVAPSLTLPALDGPLEPYRTRNGNLSLRPLAAGLEPGVPSG